MYHAFAAGLRSAEMGRQVGAAIVSPAGDVLSVGTNDVPKGSGGLYWAPDQPDHRDFARQPPLDSNTVWQRRIARELLVRMANADWLRPARVKKIATDGLDVTEGQLDAFLKDVRGTRFQSLTEFGRAVHAEMDALTSAARRGVGVDGAVVACTTFPCHNCTRHLIASGIRRLLYVHPYAKSLARDLHFDALDVDPSEYAMQGGVRVLEQDRVIFEQYVGVAPRVYPQYFDFGQTNRKSDRGQAMESPDPASAIPRVVESSGGFAFGGPTLPASRTTDLERELVRDLRRGFSEAQLHLPTASTEEDEE
jgi:cytidine deaminase